MENDKERKVGIRPRKPGSLSKTSRRENWLRTLEDQRNALRAVKRCRDLRPAWVAVGRGQVRGYSRELRGAGQFFAAIIKRQRFRPGAARSGDGDRRLAESTRFVRVWATALHATPASL